MNLHRHGLACPLPMTMTMTIHNALVRQMNRFPTIDGQDYDVAGIRLKIRLLFNTYSVGLSGTYQRNSRQTRRRPKSRLSEYRELLR
jgi:hypothetical protein